MKVSLRMKSCCYFLIWMIFKLAGANDAYVDIWREGSGYPALVFAEEKNHIFLVSQKLINRGERLSFTCPPSEDEVETFLLTSKLPQQTEEQLENEEAKLQTSSSSSNETESKTSSPESASSISELKSSPSLSSKDGIHLSHSLSSKNKSTLSLSRNGSKSSTSLPSEDELKLHDSPPPSKNESILQSSTDEASLSKSPSANYEIELSNSPSSRKELPPPSISRNSSKSSTSSPSEYEDKRQNPSSSSKDRKSRFSVPWKVARILPRISPLSRKKTQLESSSSEEEERSSEESSPLPKDERKSQDNRIALASQALPVDIKWSASLYFCQNKYKPQTVFVKDCGRYKQDGTDEEAKLYSVGYKVLNEAGNSFNDLFVYAKCYSNHLQQPLYVMYEIVSLSPKIEEHQPINDDFDPTKFYHKNVLAPYHFDEQEKMLEKLDESVVDKLIPQRLIPTYSLSTDFSKGTVSDDQSILSPQWLSKAKIWDDFSRVVFEYGRNLNWLIYTGTIGTCNDEIKNKPVVLEHKTGSKLSVPLYWWTMIMKINSTEGRGIIIGMLNQPITSRVSDAKNFQELCVRKKTCEEYSWDWKEIIREKKNSRFLICCRVTVALTKLLIGDSVDLYPLSLKTEKKKVLLERDSVNVSTLLTDFNYIGERSVRARKARDEGVAPPSEPPSAPVSLSGRIEDTSPPEPPFLSAPASPDRNADSAAVPLSSDREVEVRLPQSINSAIAPSSDTETKALLPQDERQAEPSSSPADESTYTSAAASWEDENVDEANRDEDEANRNENEAAQSPVIPEAESKPKPKKRKYISFRFGNKAASRVKTILSNFRPF